MDRRNHSKRRVVSILAFVVLTFLITWGTGMVVVLSSHAELVNGAHRVQHAIPLPLPVAIALAILGGWGPSLAALAATAGESGRSGVRELLQQFRRWAVGPVWFVIALLGPSLLGFIALVITAVSGGATQTHWFSPPSLRLAVFCSGRGVRNSAGAVTLNLNSSGASAHLGLVSW